MAQVNVWLSGALVPFDGNFDVRRQRCEMDKDAGKSGEATEITDLADLLPLFGTGGAYEGIHQPDKEDYDKIKSALFSAFSPNRFDAFNELVERRLGDSESVDVYHVALTNLATVVGSD